MGFLGPAKQTDIPHNHPHNQLTWKYHQEWRLYHPINCLLCLHCLHCLHCIHCSYGLRCLLCLFIFSLITLLTLLTRLHCLNKQCFLYFGAKWEWTGLDWITLRVSWQKSTSGARNFGKPWPLEKLDLANMRIISGSQTRSVSKVQSRIHNAGVQDPIHPWEFEPQRILPTHY